MPLVPSLSISYPHKHEQVPRLAVRRVAPRTTSTVRSTRRPAAPASDPNLEIVVQPYLRGTLALLAALPADRPVGAAELARLIGGRTPAWPSFLAQLLGLRLADDVGLDGRPLFLISPAGLILRGQLCRPAHVPASVAQTLLDRLGLERLALLEALAEQGPLSLREVVEACADLPGNNREPPLARSRFLAMTRRHRLLEPVPEDELIDVEHRRYRATDAAWRIVAARRRLHPAAYDLTPFATRIAATRADRPAVDALRRRGRRRSSAPGQLSLF